MKSDTKYLEILTNGMFLLNVLASFSFIDYISDIFIYDPLPALPTDLPHLLPLCFGIYIVNIYLLYKNKCKVLSSSFIFLVWINLIWISIEIFHGFQNQKLSRTLIQNLIWFSIIYEMICAQIKVCKLTGTYNHENIYKIITISMFCFSVIHLVAFIIIKIFGENFIFNYNEIITRNSVSYISVIGIYLLLFYKKIFKGRQLNIIAIFIFSLVPFIINTRSAIILMSFIYLIKIALYVFEKNKILCIVVSTVVILIFGNLYSNEIRNKLYEYSFGTNFNYELSRKELSEMPGSEASVYIRNRTSLIVIKTILKNPIIGVGFSELRREKAVAGYWCHTYYFLIAGAYGMLGLIPFILFFYIEIKDAKSLNKMTLFVFLAIVFGIWTFTPDLYLWFAILLNLFRENEFNLVL